MAFNPNLHQSWYMGVVQLINSITMLAMPVTPAEIALAKVWANGLVIIVATARSLGSVIHAVLAVPILGSVWLFLLGTVAYLFSASAIGIFLSTLVRSMPQFGLLLVPVILPMIALSGGLPPSKACRWHFRESCVCCRPRTS